MSAIFGLSSGKGDLPGYSCDLTDSLKERLKEAFIHSVGKRMQGVERVGIMFSGGIDSALIAHVARRFNSKLFPYSVGMEGSEDIRYAKKFAGELGLEVRQIILSEEELISYYEKVQSLLCEKDFIKIELAIPVFICSEIAKKDGVRVILTGSGAEELFAGYDRHLQCFLKGGDLQKMLSDELRALHSKDLKSIEHIASLNQCELRYPFLDEDFIKSATSLKPELNLSRDGEKKRILKLISIELGLPREIAERPKKAMQYGSGIHKILLKAKKESLIK
ncbi:MAG: Asparagine synthetase [glutamine-hydrolyzing] [Candidatus Fermentimicrarchaeum limneticum]|uniref:Asparagine synthetase [glutamine-hydrolyzing] n=1 Tax=Fermentimicrarchaeum limneticum TaxID=2795018 RepID=A0A7D5XJT8_FERL1|nr:MAG: Asparagine synthetase [glutamine-hydrolyzing] [Candidatus Fermentimicrarchaeum limneticum]